MTVEVDGMVIFWQISYGLPASVHVTVCPGEGIGGRLQTPAGAFACGRGRGGFNAPREVRESPREQYQCSNQNFPRGMFEDHSCFHVVFVR